MLFRSGRDHAAAYDKQCHRFRYGDCRPGRADHDMAGHDPDRISNRCPGENPGDPDSSSGSTDMGILGIYAQEELDPLWRHESGSVSVRNSSPGSFIKFILSKITGYFCADHMSQSCPVIFMWMKTAAGVHYNDQYT